MNTYILTIISNLKTDKECGAIAKAFTFLICEDTVHYFHNKNGTIVLTFKSNFDKEFIYDYTGQLLLKITDTYILSEIHDNLTVSVPDKLSGFIFDNNDLNPYVNPNYNMVNSTHPEIDILVELEDDDDDEDYDDFEKLIRQHRTNDNHYHEKISLDDILDKIKNSGMESLTERELIELKKYSE